MVSSVLGKDGRELCSASWGLLAGDGGSSSIDSITHARCCTLRAVRRR